MKTENIFIFMAILCLLVGGLTGFVIGDKPVKLITQEVIKEVPVEHTVTETIVETIFVDYLADAKQEFWKAVEEDDEIAILGKFDFDSLSEKKTSDEFKVKYLDDDEYFVQFSLDVKFKEEDLDTKVLTFDVKVTYEDEAPLVELL